jgi:hypothetical protein
MQGACVWQETSIPIVSAAGWSRDDLHAGFRELERVRRETDAAFATLLSSYGMSDRDSVASMARTTLVSSRVARERVQLGEIVRVIPEAGALLAKGDVSAEHVLCLRPVRDDPDAADLLALAINQSPENFKNTVTRYALLKDPKDYAKRQRDARSVKFFTTKSGCIGMRAILSTIDGAELHGILRNHTDAKWRAEHPERAETEGGHGGDPFDARMADSLVDIVRGDSTATAGKPTVVITIDADTLDAEVVGDGPIPLADALDAAVRGELFSLVKSSDNGILKFGRNRRFASRLQKLALIVRDRGCVFPGCKAHWSKCHAHHTIEYEDGGTTDIDKLVDVCGGHHPHTHINNLRIVNRNGHWIIEPKPSDES